MATSTCTNADLGRVLGLTHSAVSRMRSGERTGSVETLSRLASASGHTLEAVVDAARKARGGDLRPWVDILDEACTPKS